MKIIENAWSVTLFLQKASTRVTLQEFLWILGEHHCFFTTLYAFCLCFLPDLSESVGVLLQNDPRGSVFLELTRGIPGIPGSGVTKCGSDVSFHVRPLVRLTGV